MQTAATHKEKVLPPVLAAQESVSDLARNDAFRKIGRNVYFFQLIEAALKHLIVHGNVEGYVRQIPAIVEKETKAVAKQTMGHLVDSFIKGTYQTESADRVGPADLQEAWVSFTYKIEADPEFARVRKRALKLLVKERNDLVHRQLPQIQPGATERWLELSAFLDQQRERLVVEFEDLRSMIRTLTDVRNEALLELDNALTAAHAGDATS